MVNVVGDIDGAGAFARLHVVIFGEARRGDSDSSPSSTSCGRRFVDSFPIAKEAIRLLIGRKY